MKRALAPIVIAAIAVCAMAQESATLRYDLKQGKVYRYSMGMKMSMEGGPMSMDMKMNMISCLKVKEVVDGFINTVNYFEYFRVSSSQPGMDQMMGGQESELKKLRISQQFDFLGKPKGEPTVGGGAMAGQIGMLGGLTGTSALGITLPKDPISVGTTWEQPLDLGKSLGGMLGGDSKDPLKMSYTVKSFGEYRGRKAVTIQMVLKGSMSMGAPGGEGGEAQKVGLTMDGKGDMVIDQLTGLTLKSATTVDFDISAAGVPAGGSEKMKQTIKVSSELLDLAKL